MSIEKEHERKTTVSRVTEDEVIVRGYNIIDFAEAGYSFPDGIFLLYQSRIATKNEENMLSYEMAQFMEHILSPSAVGARSVATGRPLLSSALAAGIMTFGFAHGPGQSYACMMIHYLERAAKEGKSLEEMAEILVKEYTAKGQRVAGIHQPQHIRGDPRAYPTFRRTEELGTAHIFHDFQTAIQNTVNKIREKAGKRRLHPNMIGAGGSTLLDLGFSPLAGWAIGILARGLSCVAHAAEEMEREAPWRASLRAKTVQLLDLSLLDPKKGHYDGPPNRPAPPRGKGKKDAVAFGDRLRKEGVSNIDKITKYSLGVYYEPYRL